MNRLFLTKLHLILAAFMFPAVLMFLATGALYTWGSKGEWFENSYEVTLAEPYATQSQGDLTSVAVQVLLGKNVPIPSGAESLSGEGAEQELSWTGARSEVSVTATDNPMVAKVTVKEASFHRWLVQLHKAKGSTFFKAYATFLAFTLFVLVASGMVMGLQSPPLRRLTIGSSAAGAVGFVAFVLLG